MIPMTAPKPSGSTSQRDDCPAFAGVSVNRDHGGLGEEVELTGGGPGVGTHDVGDHEIAVLEPRQFDLVVDDVDAVAGGPRKNGGLRRTAAPEARDRIRSVLVMLAAEEAIDAIVQVVPPATLSLCPAHDGRISHRCGSDDEATGLGDDAHLAWNSLESLVDRPAEGLDLRHRRAVGDRESAADIQDIEGPLPHLFALRHQACAHAYRLYILRGVGRLRSHVKRKTADPHAELASL